MFHTCVLPDSLCTQIAVFHIQVLSPIIYHLFFAGVVLNEVWSSGVDVLSLRRRNPQNL